MSKIVIHGTKEDGTFDAECIPTAVLVTWLIDKLPNLCEAEIRHELEDIRKSAEGDARTRKTYAAIIKRQCKKHKGSKCDRLGMGF